MINKSFDFLNLFKKRGDKVACIYLNVDNGQKVAVTYTDLVEIVKTGSYFFHNILKLKTGERIAFFFDNSIEMLVLYLIGLIRGYVICPLDIKMETEETILKKVSLTKSKVLFYRSGKLDNKIIKKIVNTFNIQTYSIEDYFGLKKIFGNKYFEKPIKKPKIYRVLIIFTSGTTGFSKGVVLSNENVYTSIKQMSKGKIVDTDVFYIVMPLNAINSTMNSLATLFVGGTVVISSRYSNSLILDHITEHNITVTSVVPTILYDIYNQKNKFDILRNKIKLRYITIGSAPLSQSLAVNFVSYFKIILSQGWGLTETTGRVMQVPINIDKKKYSKLILENSIGKTLYLDNVKLVDSKNEIISKENIVGEFVVKGKNVFKGYVNNSLKVSSKGYYSGDLGYYKIIDNDKYFFLQGRKNDIIIKGGKNISPIYVEEKIRNIASWASDIVVVGFPHPRYGEEVGLVIGVEMKRCVNKIAKLKKMLEKFKIPSLSHYETPQSYVIANTNEIIKTRLGKVQHSKIKEYFKDKLINNYFKK